MFYPLTFLVWIFYGLHQTKLDLFDEEAYSYCKKNIQGCLS